MIKFPYSGKIARVYNSGYRFVQTVEMAEAGIGLTSYGALMIPVDATQEQLDLPVYVQTHGGMRQIGTVGEILNQQFDVNDNLVGSAIVDIAVAG